MTYVEVDLLSWGGRRHPDSQGDSLLSLLENDHRNKAFLDQTGVIIRTNAIGALLQHYSLEVHRFIPHNEWPGRKRAMVDAAAMPSGDQVAAEVTPTPVAE